MFYQTYTARRLPKGPKKFFVLGNLDLDLDLETRPSEGSNTFSV